METKYSLIFGIIVSVILIATNVAIGNPNHTRIAYITAPADQACGSTLTFQASSYDADLGHTGNSFNWYWADGSATEHTHNQTITHSFSTPGCYIITLRGFFSCALTADTTAEIRVLPLPPQNTYPIDNATNQPVTGVTLQWKAPEGAINYKYDVYFGTTDPPATTTAAQGITETSWQTGPLAGNTQYYWRIDSRVVCREGANDLISQGTQRSFTTGSAITAPSAPSNFMVTSVAGDSTRLDLNWIDHSGNELGFKIERKLSSLDWASAIEITKESGITSHSDIGLNSQENYSYQICAYNSAGQSDWVDANPTITSPCPANPSSLSVVIAVEKSVELTWVPNSENDLDGYNICRKTSGSNYTRINPALISKSSINYTDSGLDNGTTYFYTIKAVDETGNESAASDEISATPQDLPPAKPVLTATVENGCANLSWSYTPSAPDDIDYYRVYRSLVTGGPYTRIKNNVELTNALDDVSSSSISNRTYYYVVTAVDEGSNESAHSNEMPASVLYPVHNLNRDIRYATIQSAINAALDNETIQVPASSSPYHENISLTDKKITLISTDSEHPINTVIEAKSDGNVITFGNGNTSTIKGFTIQKAAEFDSPHIILCDNASPTIANCVISANNSSSNGAGIWIANGSLTLLETNIENNITTGSGAGIYGGSNATILVKDCIIKNNIATLSGGAIYGCSGQILRTKITDNSSSDGVGAIANSACNIRNSYISGNSGQLNARALYLCGGEISNCTIIGNIEGAANLPTLSNCSGKIENCIIYNNYTGTANDLVNYDPEKVNYCCIQKGNYSDGTGNINLDPNLAIYYLQDGSPCINKGNPDYIPYINETDIDGRMRLCSAAIDMGAYEYGKVVYVDKNVNVIPPAVSDGLSWSTAYKYLQDALAAADLKSGDEIWVANGIYYPDEKALPPDVNDDRNQSFVLVPSVSVYGGFAGNEGERAQRNIFLNECILSGDIDDATDNEPNENKFAGNSYHIVTGASNAVLDGFIIENGYADSAAARGGGGVCCSNASPSIVNCTIRSNYAKYDQYGGGLYADGNSSPKLINCLVIGNFAAGNKGGGLYKTGTGTIELLNCTIANNAGDGVHCDGASLEINNSIVWYNRTSINDVMNYPVREIILENAATANIQFSNIENGQSGIIGTGLFWGNGNINQEPKLISLGYWDVRKVDGVDLVPNQTSFPVNPNQVTIYDFASQHAHFGKGGSSDEDYFVTNLINKRPVWDGTSGDTSTLNQSGTFSSWWELSQDNGLGHFNMEVPWVCENADTGIFELSSNHFFPFISGDLGSGDQSMANCTLSPCPLGKENHNWYFTLQYHTTCTFVPGMTLYFKASDDLFIAINNRIVLERGGYYVDRPSETELTFNHNGTVTIHYIWANPPKQDEVFDFALSSDSIYDFDLFYAQRHKSDTGKYPILVIQRTGSDNETSQFYILGDYHLQSGSPCIDAGDNDAVPFGTAIDLDGKVRRVDDSAPDTGHGTKPIVDMGAYEYVGDCGAVHVNAGTDKTTTMPKDTVQLLDAAIPDEYKGLVNTTWTVLHAPQGCSVDFDPNTLGIESTSGLLNPNARFIVDNNIFVTVGHASFELKLSSAFGQCSDSDTVVIKVHPGQYQNQAHRRRPAVTKTLLKLVQNYVWMRP